MGQTTFNYTTVPADKDVIRTPLDVVALMNRQLLRLSQVLNGPQLLDRGLVPTAITLDPGVVDCTQMMLTGTATITLEMTRTRSASEGKIEIRQDATGGRAVTWVNALTTPTIAAGANARTLLLAVRVSDGWVLTTLASGY